MPTHTYKKRDCRITSFPANSNICECDLIISGGSERRAEMAAEEEITEYERRRLENIKRNDQVFAALKINHKLNDLSSVVADSKRQRAQGKSYKKSPVKKPKTETPVILRRSLRTQGIQPDGSTAGGLKDDDNQTKKSSELKFSSASEISPEKPATIRMRESYTLDDGSDSKLVSTILQCSEKYQFSECTIPCNYTDRLERSEHFMTQEPIKKVWGSVSVDALKLEPENIARLLPGKILSLKFFPTPDLRMLVVGNKFGNLGFWNVEGKTEDGDGIYVYHPHSAPVSGIATNPLSMSKLYSASYDGNIRSMDVEKEEFGIAHNSEYAIYSLSLNPHNSNTLYYSEGGGDVGFLDLRGPKCMSSCAVHDDRINSIDFNTENDNVIATSCTDGTACIWDLRLLSANMPKSIKIFKHKRSAQSAYFSPSGKFLATTSFDDKVCILSGANYEESSMVHHNNQTGRWVSSFRGIWGWDDSYIFIGNMKRGVDIISVAEKRVVATMESEHVSAIPARFDAHPYHVGMLAGATSGGQVYIWTKS